MCLNKTEALRSKLSSPPRLCGPPSTSKSLELCLVLPIMHKAGYVVQVPPSWCSLQCTVAAAAQVLAEMGRGPLGR